MIPHDVALIIFVRDLCRALDDYDESDIDFALLERILRLENEEWKRDLIRDFCAKILAHPRFADM